MGSITTKPEKVPSNWEEYLRTIKEPPTICEPRTSLSVGVSQRLGGVMTGVVTAAQVGYQNWK